MIYSEGRGGATKIKSVIRGCSMMLILGMTIFIMSMTTRASTNYANLKQSLGTAMYQAARDVAYDQSMDFSSLLSDYSAHKEEANRKYTDNFEARLATLLPDAARELKIKYYNVDASKGLIDCTASYKITLWGKEREVADHETVIIEQKAASDVQSYTISVDPNGGEFVDPRDGHTSSGVSAITISSEGSLDISNQFGYIRRDGWTFTGWYDAENGGNKLSGDVVSNPVYSTTYYAHWTKNDYSITYDLNGGHFTGTYPQSFTDVEDADIELPEPVKDGYTFEGWTGDGIDGMSKTVIIPKGSRDNRKYTAHWKVVTYTATIDTNGGTTSGPLTYSYTPESDDIVIPDPTLQDFDFVGWQRSDGVTGNTNVIKKGTTQDISFMAKWQKHEYSITYVLYGGTANNPTTYLAHDSITLNAPTRDGFIFTGWTDQDGNEYGAGTNGVLTLDDQTGDKTFVATWTPTTCKITFQMDSQTSWSSNEDLAQAQALANVPYGTVINTADMPRPQKNGLAFMGWFLPDGTTSANGYIVTGDTVLTPKFYGDRDSFTQKITLRFEKKDESWGDELTYMNKNVRYGSTVKITNAEITDFINSHQNELKAQGIDDATDGGQLAYDLTGVYVGSIAPVESFTQISEVGGATNHTQVTQGWTTNFNYTVTGDGSATLYIYRKTKAVTYKGMAGTSWASDQTAYKAYGESVIYVGAQPEYTPTPDYYDGSCVGYKTTHVQYDDGTEDPTQIRQITISGIPTVYRVGYDFNGWYLENQRVDASMAATQNLSFVQKWTPHKFNILYHLDEKSYSAVTNNNPSSYTIESGRITLNAPTRPGYTFDGWSGTGISGVTKNVTIPTGSYGTREYTAHWTPIVYTISYNTASRFGILASGTPTTYTIEDNVSIPDPSRQGYTFDGWTENQVSGTSKVISSATKSLHFTHVYGNRSFTATWEQTVKQTDYSTPGYITEPAWNANNAKSVKPGASVAKDPRLHSSISVESYGYIEVVIPKILVQMQPNGKKVVKDAFSLEGIDYTNFKLIAKTDTSYAGSSDTYFFIYKKAIPANGETPPLFTSIKATPYVALYNNDGTLASDQSVSGHVTVTGFVTNTLAEDDENMSSSEIAAYTRQVMKKSRNNAGVTSAVYPTSMYDTTDKTTASSKFQWYNSNGNSTFITGSANGTAITKDAELSGNNLSFNAVGSSQGWFAESLGNFMGIATYSHTYAPWGRKLIMTFDIKSTASASILMDFNAGHEDGSSFNGASNDAYGDTRCYLDNREVLTSREIKGDSASAVTLNITPNTTHTVTLVMANTSSKNAGHENMFAHNNIGIVQSSGTNHFEISNISYGVTD